MTEYVFSNGRLTIRHDATLKSGRWQPHALKPAFMVLEPLPPETPSSDPVNDQPEEGEDGKQEDS